MLKKILRCLSTVNNYILCVFCLKKTRMKGDFVELGPLLNTFRYFSLIYYILKEYKSGQIHFSHINFVYKTW